MKIDEEVHRDKKQTITALQQDRLPWWRLWRDIADYYLPKRYSWLRIYNGFWDHPKWKAAAQTPNNGFDAI